MKDRKVISRLLRNKKTKEYEPSLFNLFVTERMEDYAALSLATLIIILVLVIYQ